MLLRSVSRTRQRWWRRQHLGFLLGFPQRLLQTDSPGVESSDMSRLLFQSPLTRTAERSLQSYPTLGPGHISPRPSSYSFKNRRSKDLVSALLVDMLARRSRRISDIELRIRNLGCDPYLYQRMGANQMDDFVWLKLEREGNRVFVEVQN